MEYIKDIQTKNEDLVGHDHFIKTMLMTFNLNVPSFNLKSFSINMLNPPDYVTHYLRFQLNFVRY
jgi:hypothetical protein